MERCGELAKACIKRKWQRRQQRVIGRVLEVGRDALRAGDHVAMRKHDALRIAGAAGCIEDRGHVGVDHAMTRASLSCEHVLPFMDWQLQGGRRAGGTRDHHMTEIGTFTKCRLQQRKPLGRRDQHTHVAVAQDVCNLPGLEERVDRDEHATGRGGAECGDDDFRALVEIDANALRAGEAELQQSRGEGSDAIRKGAVGDCLVAEGHRWPARVPIRRRLDQLMQ